MCGITPVVVVTATGTMDETCCAKNPITSLDPRAIVSI
jgi:hypothetical protein